MSVFTRRVLFVLFFISGFASLAYQVVWTRLAFAAFGIITPVLSVVLSVFMLGLALGSWAGGHGIGRLSRRTGVSAIYFYSGTELIIGLGALLVPGLFKLGQQWLLTSGQTDSVRYLGLSALVLAATILPWCFCMGATFPLMLAFIREQEQKEAAGFSFLYLANVLGAMSGTLMTALIWIEMMGFHQTLRLAAAGNFTIAFISLCLGWDLHRQGRLPQPAAPVEASRRGEARPAAAPGRVLGCVLFSTGFLAMAMEVVWTRAFTPVIKTEVYAFAMILFAYLGATALGSWWYRRDLRAGRRKPKALLLGALAVTAFLPVILDDFRLVQTSYLTWHVDFSSALVILASIGPFCALLGYLTPGLVDEYAEGHPRLSGQAYACNVAGCILGPLFAGYLLLPFVRERFALILLGLPFCVFWWWLRRELSPRLNWGVAATVAAATVWSVLGTKDFEATLRQTHPTDLVVRRDYAATVMSFGTGMTKHLLVNGIGMTLLAPVTKFMVHLPLAYHPARPESVLVICFGMGTSFRSALSWNADTTVVELVPGVVKAFGFYHADAARFASATNAHLIVDDGRRFLLRTSAKYDAVVVDPPPPLSAAGSSLLYSRDFYELVRQHLKPGGIVQMWLPSDRDHEHNHVRTVQAALRAMDDVFPHMRCFGSIQGQGLHLLGSMEPIEHLSAAALAARMPESARQDLMEWYPDQTLTFYLQTVLDREVTIQPDLNPDPSVVITDDWPLNEYYLLNALSD